MRLVAGVAAALAVVVIVMTIALTAALGSGGALMAGPTQVTGIPPEYLALYVRAAERHKIDWAVLAAIGSVETDHGRSRAPGVHSGVNFAGCCAGPMQFSLQTWRAYGRGGDIYDPADAISGAARYLVASGAPRDYHRAVLAYNHAEWYYAAVMSRAAEYRAMAVAAPAVGQQQAGPIAGQWLVAVPGTGAECDARIVAQVVAILRRWHATLGDCYAPTGHDPGGEHPIGLAVDLTPTPPSSWRLIADLARWAGWRPACASSGCAGKTGTAFRFVGYNDFPGHGDPAHAGSNAHLHLSWDHGPGRPAAWVRLVADR